MKKFVIKLFRCRTLQQSDAKVIDARNVDNAYAQAQHIFKPKHGMQFVGAERIIYRK